MSRYTKRRLTIDAWRWLFTSGQEQTPAWVTDALWKWPSIGGIAFEPNHSEGPRICIATLDAIAVVSPGDWICKGVKGELYPCKHDIFEELYEPEVKAARDSAGATI